MILVFDLDDTLYEELTFVRSGFKSVSKYLNKNFKIPQSELYSLMLEYFKEGRGEIFDGVLKDYQIYSKKLVKKCVSVYRLHQPNIFLYPDVKKCFKRFKNLPIYIVTNGNKTVQRNKIESLKLDKMVKRVFITRQFGIKHEKPSSFCLKLICKIEKVKPKEVLYIGDDPEKDFVGIKPLGFKTIRILRGNHKNKKMAKSFEADYKIKSLDEITIEYLKKIMHTNFL